jgi:hypothetical protein
LGLTAVLRHFRAKTAHHPPIHAVLGDFQLIFSQSLTQKLTPAF